MPYKGVERRKHSDDHDTVIELVAILKSHVDSNAKNWERFDDHVADDKKSFDKIGDKLWLHAKYIYIAIGGVGLLELLMGLHK